MGEVSVIVPAWRAAGTIGRALASVAAQTRRPAQVVVCDDGSEDATFAAAQAWSDRLAVRGIALVVLRQPNLGAGAARNRCLEAATGEFVAFLDADDEWLPTKLERSLAQLTADRGFVGHDMLVGEQRMDCARHFRAARDPFAALFVRGFVATSTVVARLSAVREAGCFDPGLRSGQDYDLWLGIAARHRFAIFPEALTRYHVTPGSITSNTAKRRQCNMTILCRHLPTLRRPLVPALKRLAVIHAESLAVHRARGEWGRALAVLAELPANALRVARPLGGVQLVLSLWVLGMTAAYLAQFRDMAQPIFKALGL